MDRDTSHRRMAQPGGNRIGSRPHDEAQSAVDAERGMPAPGGAVLRVVASRTGGAWIHHRPALGTMPHRRVRASVIHVVARRGGGPHPRLVRFAATRTRAGFAGLFAGLRTSTSFGGGVTTGRGRREDAPSHPSGPPPIGVTR